MLRGSEWIKADFHIHTLGTKKNDQFSERESDKFFNIFFKKAYENKIKIIGITDYFDIENYKIAQEELDKLKIDNTLSDQEREFFKEILLIPNIELRIGTVTGKGRLINIHCLFSPNRLSELSDHFFSEMKCGIHKMTKTGIIELGKSYLKNSNNEEEFYKKGIEVFYVTIEDLEKVKNYFKDDLLIGVSNSSCDGVSGIKGHEEFYNKEYGSIEEIQRRIYSISDFIFSANPKDREYFLGKKNGLEEIKKRCKGVKACFHGSDAHIEDKIFKPDNNRYCWVKCEPTFEGIKQVIQEPEDRVVIQENKPDDKKNYNIIDSICFQDNNGDEIKVYFNQNLNTIIGGKSTGKSLLLKNIVNLIDKEYLKSKIEIESFSELSNFKIEWKDKIKDEKRNVEYIPQTYLNHLLNNKNKESQIDKTAEKIMKQDNIVKENLENINEIIKNKEKYTDTNIDKYFDTEEKIKNFKEELNLIGSKNIIKKEVEDLNTRLKILQDNDEIDIISLDKIKNKINENENKDFKNKEKLENIRLLQNNNCIFEINYLEILKSLESDEINEIIKNTEDKLKIILLELEKNLTEKQNILIEEKDKLTKELIPYNDKIKNKEELERIENLLLKENEKLKKINSLEIELEKENFNKDNYNQEIINIFENYKKIYDTELEKKVLKKDFEKLKIEIKYELSMKYWENLYECLNGTSLRGHLEYSPNILPNLEELKNLYLLLEKEEIKLKKGYNKKDVLKTLTKNPFILKYDITENGININNMSEGNKSFVLLELIIQLGNNEFPILIDQPEDDLDNRSVYEGLVKFLKNKKKERQIIVATHNANIVVGADAENIIVANQNGVGTENYNKRQFDYKNGALENQTKDSNGILRKRTIQEHICEILEGGKQAFERRKRKYKF